MTAEFHNYFFKSSKPQLTATVFVGGVLTVCVPTTSKDVRDTVVAVALEPVAAVLAEKKRQCVRLKAELFRHLPNYCLMLEPLNSFCVQVCNHYNFCC